MGEWILREAANGEVFAAGHAETVAGLAVDVELGRQRIGRARCRHRSRQIARPAGVTRRLVGSDRAERAQRLVHLVGIARLGPGLGAHARDRLGIEPAERAGIVRVLVAARPHGLAMK